MLLQDWAARTFVVVMVDATKTTALPIGRKLTDTQIPVVHKNIFHLFRFTQPVKYYSYSHEYHAEVYCSQLSFNFFFMEIALLLM